MFSDPVVVALAVLGVCIAIPGIGLFVGCPLAVFLRPSLVLIPVWALVLGGCVLGGVIGLGIAVLSGTIMWLIGVILIGTRADARIARWSVIWWMTGVTVVAALPVLLVLFGGDGLELYRRFGLIDFAGTLPFAAVPGVLALALAVVVRDTGRGAPSALRQLAGVALIEFGTLSAVLGFELVADELTPVLALNVALFTGGAGLAGLLVGALRRRWDPWRGAATGMLAGGAAALAGAASLEPLAAFGVGMVAGLIGASGRVLLARQLARPLLAGSAVGIVALGLLAVGPGFAYSGQPTLLMTQGVAWLLVVAWAAIVAVSIGYGYRRG